MTFVELYGEQLDHELGSSDRTERFTTLRRKNAINQAQREFVLETDCFMTRAQIDLVTDIAEYDLESVINDEAFFRFTDEQPFVQMTDSNGVVTVIGGTDFPQLDIPYLDREQPGWQTGTASSPSGWYRREDHGRTYLGLQPAPSIPSGSSWLLFVPYSAYPADMVLDADEPFQLVSGGNPKTSLRAYHQGLVHFAASQLEKLRRNDDAVKSQRADFRSYTRRYLEKRAPTGGTRVSFARNYFGETRRQESVGQADWWRR